MKNLRVDLRSRLYYKSEFSLFLDTYYNIGAEFRNMVIFFEQEGISKFYLSCFAYSQIIGNILNFWTFIVFQK